ncbi:glutathione-disulfide reductase [Camelimonas abortus]|uniref:Glutathione reductase n=1 Tax=Camelimonas abortus TaxID=1017184 RepID=A0ABV7LFB8_9HYPH
MSAYDTDLFVIGGGSGGVRAARVAAGHGARVMLAEEFRMGGTCVIRGCVPKKLLVYASRFAHEFEDAAGFGWTLPQPPVFDWPTLIARKNAEIARLEGLYRSGLASAGVEVIAARAVLEGPNAVRLLPDNRVVTARRILIATGARPATLPDVPGVEHAVTSNEALDLPQLPRRVVVVGAGYIAVEFACIFAALGSKVTLAHRGDRLLRGFDHDVQEGLAAAMAKQMELRFGCGLRRIDRTDDGLEVALTDGPPTRADVVMLAVGRVPNTAGLGLEKAGVAVGPSGAVAVDAQSRTSVPSVYAVGDVTNRVNLTPVAIREGHAFADTVFGGRPWTVDHAVVPTAVFSTPEIGAVGLTEEEARRRHGDVLVYRAAFRPMKATLSGREERMMMKIIVDRATDRVLGVHILGEGAGEMIQTVGIAVTMGATKADFDRTIAVHPTAAEELVTMRTPAAP